MTVKKTGKNIKDSISTTCPFEGLYDNSIVVYLGAKNKENIGKADKDMKAIVLAFRNCIRNSVIKMVSASLAIHAIEVILNAIYFRADIGTKVLISVSNVGT